jgi:hypothetical protein
MRQTGGGRGPFIECAGKSDTSRAFVLSSCGRNDSPKRFIFARFCWIAGESQIEATWRSPFWVSLLAEKEKRKGKRGKENEAECVTTRIGTWRFEERRGRGGWEWSLRGTFLWTREEEKRREEKGIVFAFRFRSREKNDLIVFEDEEEGTLDQKKVAMGAREAMNKVFIV